MGVGVEKLKINKERTWKNTRERESSQGKGEETNMFPLSPLHKKAMI